MRGEGNFSIFILSLIILILMIFFVGLPKYQKLVKLEKEIVAKQDYIRSYRDYVEKMGEQLRIFNSKEEIKKKIDLILPAEFDLPFLLNFLQEKATSNGLLLKTIGYGMQKRVVQENSTLEGAIPQQKQHTIELTLIGTYEALKGFLQQVEKSARLIEVKSISMLPVKEKAEQLQFNVKVVTFSY